jgi:hypothetical protein
MPYTEKQEKVGRMYVSRGGFFWGDIYRSTVSGFSGEVYTTAWWYCEITVTLS